MKEYDYIISGAGAAGLSLLMRMMKEPFFNNKKILVADTERKNRNDHTWCFWEKTAGMFEPVIHHQWQYANFFSHYYTSKLDLNPYWYKMIRSIDFYNFVYNEAAKHANVDFIYGKVEAAGNAGNKGIIVIEGQEYNADYVFNSVLFNKPAVPPHKFYLLQHFKGLVIQTKEPVFNPLEATLMDFRVDQEHGTSFVYVLPFSKNEALIEYTIFSDEILTDQAYSLVLANYISSLSGTGEYSVIEEEFGIIPMTNINYVKRIGRVINIGTAGGQTKGSSGYTFNFIQKHSDKIVSDLMHFGYVKENDAFFGKRFKMYDSALLNVLTFNKIPGEKIFTDLFSKNPVDRVLRFLDNESSLEDEINLMATLPRGIFAKAVLQELFK